MDDLKATVAGNIIKLRTEAAMTQAELGQLLNYSDKSVSKWERAESIPDVIVLKQIADIFHVTVNDIITDHDEWKMPVDSDDSRPNNNIIIILLVVFGICTLSLLAFVILWIFGIIEWQIFIYTLPTVLITALALNTALLNRKCNMLITMALVLSLFFVVIISLPTRAWQLLLVAVPAELIVFLSFKIKKRKK